AAPQQAVRDRLIEVGRTGLGVDHEQNQTGQADRGLGLLAHSPVPILTRIGQEATRIDEEEGPARPFRARGVAVARDARPVMDDGAAHAPHALEARRLADVLTSHYRHGGSRRAPRMLRWREVAQTRL